MTTEWLGQYRALAPAALSPALRTFPTRQFAVAPRTGPLAYVTRWSLYALFIRVPQDPRSKPPLVVVCPDLRVAEQQARDSAERLISSITSQIASPVPVGCNTTQVQSLRSQWLAAPTGSYLAIHAYRAGAGTPAFSLTRTRSTFGVSGTLGSCASCGLGPPLPPFFGPPALAPGFFGPVEGSFPPYPGAWPHVPYLTPTSCWGPGPPVVPMPYAAPLHPWAADPPDFMSAR
jgi:hypothetical protein